MLATRRISIGGLLLFSFAAANLQAQDGCQCARGTYRPRSPYALEQSAYAPGLPLYRPVSDSTWTSGPTRAPYNVVPIGRTPVVRSQAYYGGFDPYDPGVQRTTVFQPIASTGLEGGGQYYVGRGILGQKKLYSSGQPLRNALRFMTP